SSRYVAIAQLMSAGILLKGNGNLSWMSVNQFSPLNFSVPDSQNSQPMIRRRISGGTNWPMPRRRPVSVSHNEMTLASMARRVPVAATASIDAAAAVSLLAARAEDRFVGLEFAQHADAGLAQGRIRSAAAFAEQGIEAGEPAQAFVVAQPVDQKRGER